LTDEQLAKLISGNPDYGEIICRCEHISRAEIVQALNNPLGAVTLNAVKKRTYSMMGRCQSGFCLPKIIRIISREKGFSPEKIIKCSSGSEVITGRVE
jgi:glycerol-3-phosphate dehydrogenase